MTLADLAGRIDWTEADASRSRWISRIKGYEDMSPDRVRITLLDGAMNLLRCTRCQWRGIRDDSGELYSWCPMCSFTGKLASDWAGRMWARAILGKAWEQATIILKMEGLVK